MSKIGVQIKLDVSKIDKTTLFKGAKGTYLDATVFIDMDNKDQHGNNGMVTQDVSKEARDAGEKGPILGNVKVFWTDNSAPVPNTTRKAAPKVEVDFDDELLPF